MAYLPDEITMIILSSLPVKSLLRFKCVSNSWRLWISNPKFKLSNNKLLQGAIAMMTPKKYSSPFGFINQQLNVEELDISLMIRDIDERCRRSTFRVLGSCYGLILINIHKHIYLWNPSTRFYTKMLELDDNLMDLGLYYTCGGLCFDTSKNVYNVVLIMSNPHYYHDDDDRQVVIVAGLEDRKWRQVEFPYDMPYVLDGITFHGRIHYRIRLSCDDHYNIEGKWNCFGRRDGIICFDLINEKFHVFFVHEPKSDEDDETIMLGLGTLNECLCMSLLDNYDKSYVRDISHEGIWRK